MGSFGNVVMLLQKYRFHSTASSTRMILFQSQVFYLFPVTVVTKLHLGILKFKEMEKY